jgi:uncharacterized protein (DUF2164 family)
MALQSIKEAVAQQVAALGPEVETAVVGVLVDQVKEKRTKAILAALSLIEETQKELKKIKPTQTFDVDGKVASEFYTKTDKEAREKINQKLAKIEKALGEAFDAEKPNFEKLFNVVQNKGQETKQDSGASEE